MSEERKTRADFETESAWWTYQITHPEEFEDENENKVDDAEEEVTIYYVCTNPKCDFIKKQTVTITKAQYEEIKEALKKGKCPKCSANGFKILTKEQFEKEKERIKKLKEKNDNEKDKKEKKESIDSAKSSLKEVKKDIKDLYDDLSKKLKYGDITPKCFINLFYNISFDIMNSADRRYRKRYSAGLINFKNERKNILDMGQIVLDYYDIKEEQEEILENFEKEADENYKVIYNVYNAKYEHDDNERFEEYKRETRLDNYIKSIEIKRKLEEKAKNKNIRAAEKIADKMKNKEERNFANSLEECVKRIEDM